MSFLAIPWVYWTIIAVYAATVLGLAGVIVSENRNPLKSLAWVTVLLTFPVGGLLLYIFFGRSIKNTRMISHRKKRALKRLEEKATLRPAGSEPTVLSRENAQLAMMAMKLNDSRLITNSRIEIFTSGKEKFECLMTDIRNARKCVSLQYYIFEDDELGHRMADLLIEKAKEGVAVRVIYDDIGSIGVRRKFFKRMARAGVQVHPFFRVAFPPFGSRINWRNHRKIVAIDGKIGYIGGMNVADRYVNGNKRFARWRDTHLRVTGAGVAALRYCFAVDWSFMGQPLDMDSESVGQSTEETAAASLTSVSGRTSYPASVQLVTSGPTDRWSNIELLLLKAIGGARKRVWIQTPYFLPPDSMLRALHTAAIARVDVRIMMPRLSDSAILTYASRSYITECLRAGMKFYFYKGGMLHSKVVIVDDDFSSVGSANIDFRSFEHNFESNLMIYSLEVNEQLRHVFSRDMHDCERVRLREWRQRPITHKTAESIMRLLSPVL